MRIMERRPDSWSIWRTDQHVSGNRTSNALYLHSNILKLIVQDLVIESLTFDCTFCGVTAFVYFVGLCCVAYGA